MNSTIPTILIREWHSITPSDDEHGDVLRGLPLTDDDRELLAELKDGIEVSEVRNGIAITTKSYIGTVTLSSVCIVVMPKMPIENLMRMVAYAFDLSDIRVAESPTRFEHGTTGIVDLLGFMLLQAVSHLVRGGLLPNYEERNEDLPTLRGRLDMRHIATHPRRATLRCTYEDLTLDHPLNQTLAAGLRFAARVMDDGELSLDLARAADRFFGDLTHIELDGETLRECIESLNRRSSHYQTALTLVQLIHQGARLHSHERTSGELPLSSFLLDMNLVFERFLERHLREHTPPSIQVTGQDTSADVFHYLPGTRWNKPTIRPDLVFRSRGKVLAVADAKYKNLSERSPDISDLYQLTIYGLAYTTPEPCDALLLYPLTTDDMEHTATLIFQAPSTRQEVTVRIVGVPVNHILDGTEAKWWPELSPRAQMAQRAA